MDASTRSFHVYGKTQSGSNALNSARGELPSSARQLLILMDGQRTIGELSNIFREDTLYRSVALLESKGYVQLLRLFPESDEPRVDIGDPISEPIPAERTGTAERPGGVEPEPTGRSPIGGGGSALEQRPVERLEIVESPRGIEPVAPTDQIPIDRGASAAKPIAAQWPDTARRPGGTAPVAQTEQSLIDDGASVSTRTPAGRTETARRRRDTGNVAQTGETRSGGGFAARQIHARRAKAPGRRRLTVPVVLGALVAVIGISWPLTRQESVAGVPKVSIVWSSAPLPSRPVSAGPAWPVKSTSAPARASAQQFREPPTAVETTVMSESMPATGDPGVGAPAAGAPDTSLADAGGNLMMPPALADGHPAGAPVLHVRDQVTPQIPKQASELGIVAGRVVALLHVSRDGTVERVELVSATPPQMYDGEMQHAFESWTFDPPGRAGRMTVQVDFGPDQ